MPFIGEKWINYFIQLIKTVLVLSLGTNPELHSLNGTDFYRCPDDISPWDKMMYACSNNKLKSEFKGVKSFEYHDTGEFNFQEMVKDLIRKDRQ